MFTRADFSFAPPDSDAPTYIAVDPASGDDYIAVCTYQRNDDGTIAVRNVDVLDAEGARHA